MMYAKENYGSVGIAGIRDKRCVGNRDEYLWRWNINAVRIRESTHR